MKKNGGTVVLLLLLATSCIFNVVSGDCGDSFPLSSTNTSLPYAYFRSSPQTPGDLGIITRLGVTFSIQNSTGALTVTEIGSNKILWTFPSNSQVNCLAKDNGATGGCTGNLQGDGNFVLLDSYGSVYAATNTYSGRAQTIFISSQPPYFWMTSSPSQNCTIVYKAGLGYIGSNPNGDGDGGSTPLPRTTSDPAYTVTKAISAQPVLPAGRWKNSFGACVHMGQGIGNGTTIGTLLNYLGACCFRDGVPSPSQYANYQLATNTGVKATLLFYGTGGNVTKNDLNNTVSYLTSFINRAGVGKSSIYALEGFNEINNQPFWYNGVNPQRSYLGMNQAMKDLYSLIKNNAITSSYSVYDMTGAVYSPNSTENVIIQNFAGRADTANIHPYPGQGRQASSPKIDYFYTNMNGAYVHWNTSTRKVATEDGYFTYTGYSSGVTYAIQARQTVNIILSAIYDNLEQVYLYELNDQDYYFNDSPSEATFGLFMTNNTAKPVAIALHYLSGLLSDTAAAQQQSVVANTNFGFTNIPSTAKYLTFQKTNISTGVYIVVWNPVPLWNPDTLSAISNVASYTVTLNLPASKNVDVFDVFAPNGVVAITPSSSGKSVTSFNFALSDRAVVVNVY